MRELPNIYKTVKLLTMAYENRKRGYLLRREAQEITRDQEFHLVQELDRNMKGEIDALIHSLDSGALDGEIEPDAEPEDSENAGGAVNGE